MAVRASDLLTLAVLPSPSYVRQYYRKQASTLAPPAAPTTNPPAAPWSTTEPTYTPGSTDTLYTVMLTAYGSVAFEYGPVQKSSSFEAAKQAYNRSDAAVSAAQDAANRAEAIIKRGDNLVINGSGELGVVEPWSTTGVTLDMAETPSGYAGAFKVAGNRSVFQSEGIPVDPSKSYRHSALIKSKAGIRHYLAIMGYDVDDRHVEYSMTNRFTPTQTKLAAPLKKGDTQLQLVDASAWVAHAGVSNRYLGVWPYQTDKGPIYQIEDGYTRHVMRIDDLTGFTISGNTVNLPRGWTGAERPAGSDIAVTLAGGTYIYPKLQYSVTDGWEKIEGTTTAGVTDGIYPTNAYKLRPGTASVRVGFLINHSGTSADTAWFTGVRLMDDTNYAAAGTAMERANSAFTKAGDAETNAKNHADALPKIIHSLVAPSGTAPESSTYFQHKKIGTNGLGEVLGQWTRSNGEWVKTDIDASIIANQHVGYLTAGSAAIDEAVLNKVWSELGVFTRLTVGAGGAWIDGVLIKENTVRGQHIIADESMTTKIFGAETGVIQYLTATNKASFLAGLDAIGESWIDGVNIKDKAITAALMNFVTDNGVNRLRLDDNGLLLERISGSRPILSLDESGLKGYDPRTTSTVPTFSFDPATGRLTAVDGEFSGNIDGSTIEGSIFETEPFQYDAANPNWYKTRLDKYGIQFLTSLSSGGPWTETSSIDASISTVPMLRIDRIYPANDNAPIQMYGVLDVSGLNVAGDFTVGGMTLTPGPWKNINKVGSWVNVIGRPPARYRIVGDEIHFSGALVGGSNGSIGTIPLAADCPYYTLDTAITKPNSQDQARLTVFPDGRLETNTLTGGSGTYLALDGAFVALDQALK